MIRITRINYRIIGDDERHPGSPLLATCVVVLEDVFMLHDIRIMDGANGVYVVMPRRIEFNNKQASTTAYSKSQKSTGDVFHPVNRDFHLYMTQTIIDGYFLCRDENKEEYFPQRETKD